MNPAVALPTGNAGARMAARPQHVAPACRQARTG
jgi:hypothetical protein